MTFKVFISSSMEDMHIVDELRKTLERYGIQPVLSPEEMHARETPDFYLLRKIPPSEIGLIPDIKHQIQNSDCILVIIGRGGRRFENVDFEIGIATALNKLVIPIVEEGSEIPKSLANREYILIDRNRPKLSYERAAQYLNRLKLEKERRNAIGGLVLLGLGLLLLGALVSGD